MNINTNDSHDLPPANGAAAADQAISAQNPQIASQSNVAPSITSQELLKSARELQIHHAGEIYRLRVTKQNKLILTK